MQKITQLTLAMKTKYPELYRYLDENPLTLPVSDSATIRKKTLQAYLESLRLLWQHAEEQSKIPASEE